MLKKRISNCFGMFKWTILVTVQQSELLFGDELFLKKLYPGTS
jgi:hypothetical protein